MNKKNKANADIFFTDGKKYRCTRDVVMKKTGRVAFKAGNIYNQTVAPSAYYGWLTNEQGERHAWPQAHYVEHEARIWGMTPDECDARNYFEPMEFSPLYVTENIAN